MTSPASALKKELFQTFKGSKFSVKTKNCSVTVKWELPIGTAATVQAVSEICKKHETVVRHGSSINDTAWSSGYDISVCPNPTQERKEWAIEMVKARNFAGATWNAKYECFDELDGREHYHATKQYREYCSNGVSSNLIDEYGREPSAKQWYYEDLEKENQVESVEAELKTIEPDLVELAKQTITPVSVSVQSIEQLVCIQTNFPRNNKHDWIEDYCNQPINIGKAQIVKIVELTLEDYRNFIHALLTDREWLKGEGGYRSHYQSKCDNCNELFNDAEERAKWLTESYLLCVLVTDGKDYIVVNPEGFGYARYVGFGIGENLNDILKLANIKLSTCFAPLPEPIVKLETNLISFPVKNFDLPALQKEDSNDLYQNYQKWVNKLVSKGEYNKLKSYEEWYAIAIKVM